MAVDKIANTSFVFTWEDGVDHYYGKSRTAVDSNVDEAYASVPQLFDDYAPTAADVSDGDTTVTGAAVVTFEGATVTDDGGEAVVTITGGGGGSQPGAAVVRGPFEFAYDTPDLLSAQYFAITAVDLEEQSVTIEGDHTAEFTAGRAVFIIASSSNDATTLVASSSFGGGNTTVVLVYPLVDDTADGSIVIPGGVPVYTPEVDEILLEAWVEVDELWGTQAYADISQYTSDAKLGLWAYTTIGGPNGQAVDLNDAADTEEFGGGPLRGATTTTSTLSLAGIQDNSGTLRVVPARFTTTDPLLLVVSTDGSQAGDVPEASAGAAKLYLITSKPVALD